MLTLNDGSTYQGYFENNTLKEGEFVHFTGLTYKGSFSRDKFFKGKIEFIDGDKLVGEWGN